ncbi:hypothetical protein HK096_007781, partial [Nowakowskiella sp. JEL0078]
MGLPANHRDTLMNQTPEKKLQLIEGYKKLEKDKKNRRSNQVSTNFDSSPQQTFEFPRVKFQAPLQYPARRSRPSDSLESTYGQPLTRTSTMESNASSTTSSPPNSPKMERPSIGTVDVLYGEELQRHLIYVLV